MSAALDNLTAKIAGLETVEASAIELLTTISAELKAALGDGTDPDTDALNALAAKIDADTGNLSAAVAANTPAANTATNVQAPAGATETIVDPINGVMPAPTPNLPDAVPSPDEPEAIAAANTPSAPLPENTAPASIETDAPTPASISPEAPVEGSPQDTVVPQPDPASVDAADVNPAANLNPVTQTNGVGDVTQDPPSGVNPDDIQPAD